MVVVGLSYMSYNSGAAILQDGVIVAAACEERFNRQKYWNRFPYRSLSYCLEYAGVDIRDVDVIAVNANPNIDLVEFSRASSNAPSWFPEIILHTMNSLHSVYCTNYSDQEMSVLFDVDSVLKKIVFVPHHYCHISSSFPLSGFDDAVCLSLDGRGERDVGLVCINGAKGRVLQRLSYPDSYGLFYGTITQYLGYKLDQDEWKVMGLSSYGRHSEFVAKLASIARINSEGVLDLDRNYFNFFSKVGNKAFTNSFDALFECQRSRGADITQEHMDLAYAAQHLLEEYVFSLLRRLRPLVHSCSNLCLSGGVFMNSVLIGKIEESRIYDNVYVNAFPDDTGTCLGAALYVADRKVQLTDNFLGPSFSDEHIRSVLGRCKIAYEEPSELYSMIAKDILSGKVIGWFQGKLEFGQRALGNRSILADARDHTMKDRLNRAVKLRESFRPFAPAVIEEDYGDFFEGSKDNAYMQKTCRANLLFQRLFPAGVHVDGTSRAQSVSNQQNPSFYTLLSEIKKEIGRGVVINTSFNLDGEPIVCTVEDAIKTFFCSGIDVLVVGPCVVRKTYID